MLPGLPRGITLISRRANGSWNTWKSKIVSPCFGHKTSIIKPYHSLTQESNSCWTRWNEREIWCGRTRKMLHNVENPGIWLGVGFRIHRHCVYLVWASFGRYCWSEVSSDRHEVLRMTLQFLETRGKAQIFSAADPQEEGVKFQSCLEIFQLCKTYKNWLKFCP